MMLSPLLRALALLAATAPVAAADAPVRAFQAEYATLRNGDEVGRTTLELADAGDGYWRLRSETRGTAGLAKLAGIHVVETSRFRWRDGRPEAVAYDYRQEGAFRQRTREARFDWSAREARVSEGGEHHRYPIEAGTIDRQSVTLGLAGDLLRDAATFEYRVAVKDHVETMRYARGPVESVRVPAGTFEATLMRRVGEPGSDRKRVSRSWFAQSLGWLPVQIEQTEKNGDTVTLKLASIRND